MTLSYKGTISIFALLICVSSAQLIYLSLPSSSSITTLNHRQYRQDIDAFIDAIKQHSAFAAMEPERVTAITEASHALLQSATNSNDAARLELQLLQLLSQLNDPGASAQRPINGVYDTNRQLQLPIEIRFDGQYWHAFYQDGAMLEPDFPYLTHIDGLPMIRWVEASQGYLADSIKLSTQAQSTWIRQIARLRLDIGLSDRDETLITLSNGEANLQYPLKLTRNQRHAAKVTPLEANALEANSLEANSLEASKPQGVVRLSTNIDLTTITELSKQLAQLSTEHGSPLIIDIRAIKQPQPLLMAWLFSQFSQQNKPQSIGLLQYKRFATSRADQLPRHYIPMSKLSFFEQAALNNQGFDTRKGPTSAFSDYLVRRYNPRVDDKSQQQTHRLSLLVDSSCELECEWIALASLQWPSVELIGETTRGSLSPRYHVTLPNSGIEVQFSKAVVYAPSGQLISGIGLGPAIQLNQLDFEDNNIAELIAAKRLDRSLAPLKGTVAIVSPAKR
ncbi:hypothetical protein Shal_3536 [Shewanella halifaxensis HAW-EB4]|uniref:Tail specific protease domain-containing protein n=1 Tax=Shewanella halifaxensis (strain HAW-EB4) TaxID=458817 RepID=B0TTD8_SHEHH|nr:hypothetical protein [Shewanella halifaxensis]ABZ78079.1 hypothetical protein Shal_3536 [Shewanella halifaxensis HAW-EB4]